MSSEGIVMFPRNFQFLALSVFVDRILSFLLLHFQIIVFAIHFEIRSIQSGNYLFIYRADWIFPPKQNLNEKYQLSRETLNMSLLFQSKSKILKYKEILPCYPTKIIVPLIWEKWRLFFFFFFQKRCKLFLFLT